MIQKLTPIHTKMTARSKRLPSHLQRVSAAVKQKVTIRKFDNKSTAALWQYLAYCIQDDHGRGTGTGKFKRQFDDVLKEGLAYATGSTGTYAVNHHSGDNNYNVRSSGLIYANSVAAATVAMEKNVHEGYKDAGGKRGSSVKENESLRNDTDPDDVF